MTFPKDFRPWTPLFVPPRLNGKMLEILLPALVAIDRDHLEEMPRIPLLYESGVRYNAEPPGEEKWLSVPWILLAAAGDCEDLACWRTAELQLKGDSSTGFRPEPEANAVWSSREVSPGQHLYHIRVRRADGRIEDPSAILGMGWEQQYAAKYGPLHGATDPNEPWKPINRMSRNEALRLVGEIRAGRVRIPNAA